jgi:hypothetical protein
MGKDEEYDKSVINDIAKSMPRFDDVFSAAAAPNKASDDDEDEEEDDGEDDEYKETKKVKSEFKEREHTMSNLKIEREALKAYEEIAQSLKSKAYNRDEHLSDALKDIAEYLKRIAEHLPPELNNVGVDKGLKKKVEPMVLASRIVKEKSKPDEDGESDEESDGRAERVEDLTPELFANRSGWFAMVLVIRDVVDMFACLRLDLFCLESDSSGQQQEVGPTLAIQKWLSKCSCVYVPFSFACAIFRLANYHLLCFVSICQDI